MSDVNFDVVFAGRSRRNRMKTYTDAEKRLGDRASLKIGNNTQLQRLDSESIAVTHFSTHIVTYFKNNLIKIDNGGWSSSTTKKRLNEYTPFNVSATNGRWHVFTSDGVFIFSRGMMFTEDGLCTEADRFKVSGPRR